MCTQYLSSSLFSRQADTSKDGRIDFQEFEAIMQNKEPSSERSGGQRVESDQSLPISIFGTDPEDPLVQTTS